MKSLCPENLSQLADRWTVLINQINRLGGRYCPAPLSIEVNQFIRQTERIIEPDPFEQDILETTRKLADDGDLRLALFRLHEVISGRL